MYVKVPNTSAVWYVGRHPIDVHSFLNKTPSRKKIV